MALVLYDRVQQTATVNTTVSFTLSGSVTGYQSFSVVGDTNTTYYGATDSSGNWEVGIGTYSTTGPTLTRTTILSSSNAGAAVTFSGTVSVFVTYPASQSVNGDGTNIDAPSGASLPVANGGTGVTAASITAFNNITGFTAAGTTGTTSTNLVFSTSPSITTLTAAGAFTASATTQGVSLGTSQSSGVLTMGGTAGTGTMTIGRSTGIQTTNIQAGATASGSTKTINIGTAGLSGSTTAIAIGSAVSGASSTVNINADTLNLSSTTSGPNFYITDGSVQFNLGILGSSGYVGTQSTSPLELRTNNVTRMTIDTSGNVGIGTSSPAAKLDIGSGNLNFSSTSQRITGDFSDATIANRLTFQTSIANNSTEVPAIPNGTSNTAGFRSYNNSDPSNASVARLIATSTDISLRSQVTGTGTYLPLTMYTSGSERLRIDTSGNVGIGTTAPTAVLQLKAGTATANTAPLKFTSGTNLTTAEAGAVEYDGTVFYGDFAASARGVFPAESIVVLNTAYTLTSQTAAQQLFNNTASGALTLPAGTYQFECTYTLSSMSSTSGSFGFALGGGATFTQQWRSWATKQAALTTVANSLTTYNTAASVTLATASVNTVGQALIRGIINITVGGTIIPQVSLGVAAAAVVGVGSYFRISPISGTSGATNITVGNWS